MVCREKKSYSKNLKSGPNCSSYIVGSVIVVIDKTDSLARVAMMFMMFITFCIVFTRKTIGL